MSWTIVLVQGKVALVNYTLRADLVFKLGVYGTHFLRTGWSWEVVDKGLLHLVPFIVEAES